MRAKSEVVYGQEVELVHYCHEVGCSDGCHLILLGVESSDFFVVGYPYLFNEFRKGWIVGFSGYFAGILDDDCLYSFISQDCAYASSSSLLESMYLPSHVVP